MDLILNFRKLNKSSLPVVGGKNASLDAVLQSLGAAAAEDLGRVPGVARVSRLGEVVNGIGDIISHG